MADAGGIPPEVLEMMQNGNGQPTAAYPDLDTLVGELGLAIVQNTKQAAGSDNPDASRAFSQAALYATQAVVALIPYAAPETAKASGAPGDNPAKPGD